MSVRLRPRGGRLGALAPAGGASEPPGP